jgi:hypothetical protein
MCTDSKQGIPTVYKGTRFRSRLEARWAASADLAGWEWVYEPFDGAGYVPDFCFTVADGPLLVEVKPVAAIEEARIHLPKILAGIGDLWDHDIIIAGISPLHVFYVDFLNGPADYNTSVSVITKGRRCEHLDIHPEFWLTQCGICRYDRFNVPVDVGYVDMLWRKAGNDTRWEPAA